MQHSEFSIGLEFWCGDKRWRCTDVGSRVVVAISLEPREMVRLEVRGAGQAEQTKTRFMSDDPRDLDGPPYGVVENVFDEYDIEECTLTPMVESGDGNAA